MGADRGRFGDVTGRRTLVPVERPSQNRRTRQTAFGRPIDR